jgi:autotransporter-associated beta strand protein
LAPQPAPPPSHPGPALDVRANIGTEAITVSGTGISSGGALITGSGTGTVGGAVTLAADSSFGGAGDLTISGAVGGSFAVTKVGAGTVTLSGTNTYTGATQIDAGTVIATNSAALGTTAGSTTITSGAALDVRRQHWHGSHHRQWHRNFFRWALITGSGTGTVGGAVTLAADSSFGGAGDLTISGAVGGSFGVAKVGTGTLTFSGSNNYTGSTTISGGTLLVNGSTTINSDVTVASGSTLGGNLTVSGEVAVSSGGRVAPGTSPGILNTGSITFTSGSSFDVEVGGTTVGTEYDQLNVTGTVDLGGATLNLIQYSSFAISSASLQTYVIINNDGTDDVVGTFAGLPEGSPVTYSGMTLYISYAGSATGDAGNDVVLNSRPIINGTSIANTFVFRKSTTANRNEFSTDGGTSFIQVDNTLPVRFNGATGVDSLNINYVNGDPAVAVAFHGGGQVGDRLTVSDTIGSGRTGVYSVDAAAPANAGALTVAGSALTFTGVSQVDATGIATVNLDSTTFPAANTSLTIAGDTNSASQAAVKISGTTGGTVFTPLFVRNTTTLSVNTSMPSGADTVTIANITGSSVGLTNLTVDTGTGLDSITAGGAVTAVNLAGNILLTSGGTLTVSEFGVVSAGNVTLNAGDTTIVQDTGINTSSGSGNVTVSTTSSTLTVQDGGITTAGNVALSAPGLVTVTGSGVSATAGTGTVQVTSTAPVSQ